MDISRDRLLGLRTPEKPWRRCFPYCDAQSFGFEEVAGSDKPDLKVRIVLMRLGDGILIEVIQRKKPSTA